jgi:chromosomal replication initiation ATPase DnaA
MNALDIAVLRARACKVEPIVVTHDKAAPVVDEPAIRESLLDRETRERVVTLTMRVTFLERMVGRLCTDFGVPAQAEINSKISVRDILRAVASYYGLTAAEIESPRRQAALIKPRHVAMYLAKQLTSLAYQEIGRQIGDKDHTTVLHGVRNIVKALPLDGQLREDIAYLTELLLPTTERPSVGSE